MNRPGTGKMALITGASSGIGQALAEEFARDGFDLALAARSRERLEEIAGSLRAKHGIQARVFVADLSLAEAADQLAAALQKSGLEIDVLVNNAGFGDNGLFAEGQWGTYQQMIQLNIASLVRLTHLLLPKMVGRRSGRVMNVGSTGSFVPVPYMAVYGATKAFVLSFTEALAAELRGTGVTVTALCPGATVTRFANRAKAEKTILFQNNTMTAEVVARMGYQALMRGKTRVVTGWFNKLMIGSLRLVTRDQALALSLKFMKPQSVA